MSPHIYQRTPQINLPFDVQGVRGRTRWTPATPLNGDWSTSNYNFVDLHELFASFKYLQLILHSVLPR